MFWYRYWCWPSLLRISHFRLQNAVFHLLRTKAPEQWVSGQGCLSGGAGAGAMAGCAGMGKNREPLAYMVKIQSQWERRVLKSLNSTELDQEVVVGVAQSGGRDDDQL